MKYQFQCSNMYINRILLLSSFLPNKKGGQKRWEPGKQRRQNRTDLIFLQILFEFKFLSKYVHIEKKGLKDISKNRTTCDVWILSSIRIIFSISIYVYFFSVLIFSIDNMWKFVTFYICTFSHFLFYRLWE